MMAQPSEKLIVAGKIDPKNGNNSTQNTDVVDMSKFREALLVVQTGSSDSTVDAKLQESNDPGFASGNSDISGKAITQLSAQSNKVVLINLKAEKMTKRYLRGVVTVGNGTTNLVAAVLLGVKPAFGPASDDKLAAVAQIVT